MCVMKLKVDGNGYIYLLLQYAIAQLRDEHLISVTNPPLKKKKKKFLPV